MIRDDSVLSKLRPPAQVAIDAFSRTCAIEWGSSYSVPSAKTVVESFFWQNYMEKIGRKATHTIADWMDFLRDYLMVTDLHEQRILWLSKELRDMTVPMGTFVTAAISR